jgi:hypothetical protein
MRLLVPPLALATTLIIPAMADASPFAVPLRANHLGSSLGDSNLEAPETSAPTMGGEAAPADASSEAAPADEAAPETPTEGPAAIEDPTAEPEAEDEDEELEDELSGPTKKGDFNANAIGIRGGIHLVPSYFLNAALASYSNSLCRNKPGKWGEQNGLVYVDGCNFYVGGDYIRRISRAFDISFGVGYLHIKPPDSLWIDNDEWDRDNCTTDGGGLSNCNLGAADYTSIDLRMFTMELNFIGRGTLYKNADVEIQMGGGGGVGVGILIGKGISRTPLGESPSGFKDGAQTPDSCKTLADTADFTKCTPHYYDDPDIDQDGDGTPIDISRDEVDANGGMAPRGETATGTGFARCSEHKCDGGDLSSFGATETGGTWPAYPLVNILGDFRIIIKDSFGISIQGGIKTGFFFGGGIQYYFGGGGKDNDDYKKKYNK